MPRRASPVFRIAPLQRVIGESITDPAELAAIDRMRKRLKRKQRGPAATRNGQRARPVSSSPSKKRT